MALPLSLQESAVTFAVAQEAPSSGLCSKRAALRNKSGAQNRMQQLRISIMSDEEPMSITDLHGAERLFAKWAIQTLLGNALKPESARPCLHRCTGRALTPQEGGLATTESEREQHEHISRST